MSLSILVAEDDETVRRVIKRTLEEAGYSVCEAADGEEAMRACETTSFDLVITDILMPEKDGLETIMFLRKQAPEAKVIAISGAGNQLFLDNAAGLGATTVLAKPFTPHEMLQMVHEVLGVAQDG